MLAVTAEADFNDPFLKYLPCTILIRDGQPVFEVIAAPEPTPMPPEAAKKAARKAATSKRLRDETTALQNTIAHNVKVHGMEFYTGTPDRRWTSRTPNEHFLNAYASGTFGRAIYREEAVWDRDAYDEAQATIEGWKWKPWKGCVQGDGDGATTCWHMASLHPAPKDTTRCVPDQVWVETTFYDGHWEAVAAQPAVAAPEARDYTPEPTTVTTDECMTKAAINKAYEAYKYATPATETATEFGDMEAALYAFAPKEGRLSQCKKLLLNSHGRLDPKDFVQDFATDLIDRFKKGQYHTHVGTIEKWIDWVWCMWFFPEVKTKFYTDANLTDAVNDNFENDEESDRQAGTLYRVDVDREQVEREMAPESAAASIRVDAIFRDLDDTTTVWGSVNETTKKILRGMRKGKTQEAAAKAAGVGERQGIRLMKKLQDANPKSFALGSPQAVAEDAGAPAGTNRGHQPPSVGQYAGVWRGWQRACAHDTGVC